VALFNEYVVGDGPHDDATLEAAVARFRTLANHAVQELVDQALSDMAADAAEASGAGGAKRR